MQRLIHLILSLTLGVAIVGIIHDSRTPPRPAAGLSTLQDDTELSPPLQMVASEAIGQDDTSYHFQANEAGYTATNPAHQFTISASDNTLTIALDDEWWQLSSATAAKNVSLVGNRLTLHRDGYDEWYINGPVGLQQGFTVYEPADIAFTVGGTLLTTARPQNLSIGDMLNFSGLMAYDANEQTVPVEFELDDNRLVYAYDDTNATYPLTIDPWVQQVKLTASDGASDDLFGWSVALDGDTALIGASNNDDNGGWSGSAYIFVRNGSVWSQQAKLLPSDGAASDFFGRSVALSGDTALIGSLGDDDNGQNSGSAYVFVRSGTIWPQQAKLLPSDGTASDSFGSAVALDGDTALIGAHFSDGAAPYSGSAYVFVRSAGVWSQQAKLFPNDGASDDAFGDAVALEGNTALIGAYRDNPNGVTSGSAYIFVRNNSTWSQQQKLIPGDGKADDHFGAVVALSGDTALITADADCCFGSGYIFIRSGSTWSQQAKLLPFGSIDSGWFGRSADLDGDTAVIGAIGGSFEATGRIFVYSRSGTTWHGKDTPLPDDIAPYDRFGMSVAVDSDTLLVSSLYDDDRGEDSGSAYIFNFEPGAFIVETGGRTEVNEGIMSLFDTYSVVLDVPPAVGEAVTINLSSNTTTGVMVSPLSLNFDLSNWSVPQTVTVTPVDDSIIEGIHTDTITHTLTTTGGTYNNEAPVRDVVVSIRDDDYHPLVASAVCVGENLEVTITSGDGPFNIWATAGVNVPVIDVGKGTTIINGPEKWDNLRVTETNMDYQSINLGQFKCRPDERPIPLTPAHQSHTTDPFPLFSWIGITDAVNYRVFVFDEQDPLLRTIDIRENSGGPTSMTLGTPLPDGRLFWRVRGNVNRIWSRWSIRFTLFKDPPVLFHVPAAQPTLETPPTQVPAPTNHPSSDGSAPPERDLPPTVPAPPPTELPQPPNSR